VSVFGENRILLWRVMKFGTLLGFSFVLLSCSVLAPTEQAAPTNTPIPPDTGVIPIFVADEAGKQLTKNVIVRVSNSAQVDSFDHEGLRIDSCDPNAQVIAAWAEGYEIAFRKCHELNIQLLPLVRHDNVNYVWTPANGSCMGCHDGQIDGSYNEYDEWLKSGHATVFRDGYFGSMYRGTDLSGRSSPPTERTITGGDMVRLPPSTGDGYRGPGYKLDFPQQPGNCAYCHAPAVIPSSQTGVDLFSLFTGAGGVQGEGVTCDVCHKVLNVALDDKGFPFADRPGALSFHFLRPDYGSFMIGPFSNILTRNPNLPVEHRLTCSPVFSKSEFCAPCHYGKFGDITIYNSYGEWKNSRYGDNPNEPDYMTCQDCHMSHMNPDGEIPSLSKRQACSESVLQNFDHNMMVMGLDETLGREIPLLVRGAASIRENIRYEPDKKNTLVVRVSVENVKAGHNFPTDSPLRHLILVVEAKDQFGTPLMQADGEHIPNWAGVGKPFMDGFGIKNYGGMPGKIFANLLVEEDTNISPTAAYWNETKPAWKDADTRLPPGEPDRSEYSFSIPDEGEIKIVVTLVYRYAFFDLMVQKEWFNRPDIIVAQRVCSGMPTQPGSIRCEDVPLKGP
jgi:hypothetical protein